jgi:hypothetical protein
MTSLSGTHTIPWETYQPLDLPAFRHVFSLRNGVPREEMGNYLASFLAASGFDPGAYAEGEQVHGSEVAWVDSPEPQRLPGVDALITNVPGLALVVRVADCGPIFFVDGTNGAIGLAHSGRRGTEANIAGNVIAAMARAFASRPENVTACLGPCIRPPHYEIDFASEIGRQCRAAGIRHYHDTGICTGTNLDRYFSYRLEKGKTGRMWAVLMRKVEGASR